MDDCLEFYRKRHSWDSCQARASLAHFVHSTREGGKAVYGTDKKGEKQGRTSAGLPSNSGQCCLRMILHPIADALLVFGVVFAQNLAFSLSVRSSNRDRFCYVVSASLLTNSLWFVSLGFLIAKPASVALFFSYVSGAVFGNFIGVCLAIRIERRLGASCDKHLGDNSK